MSDEANEPDPDPEFDPFADDESTDGGDTSREAEPAVPDGPRSEQVRHQNVGARVPEGVGRGVFATGVIVLQASHEFVLDFLQRMTRPQQVAARVVLPPPVVTGFIRALEENLGNYERKFGRPEPPKLLTEPPSTSAALVGAGPSGEGGAGGSEATQPPVPIEPSNPVRQPSAEELYDDLKLPDTMLAGNYANAVMISHTPTEFCFDFLTTFFPRSAVSARVFMAAPNIPSFLGSLKHSFEQFQRRSGGGPPVG